MWPEALPEMKGIVTNCYEKEVQVGKLLMKAIALGLGLP